MESLLLPKNTLIVDNKTKSHAETSVERSVRRTLYRNYLFRAALSAAGCLILLAAGFIIYHQTTYVDTVKPDYSLLDTQSNTYWTDRILIDMDAALQSAGTEPQRRQRLRTFVNQTLEDAMKISPSYNRAQAVTSIARVLAQHDVDLVPDNHLQRLGSTSLIVSLRARTLISQALMYIRLEKKSAAQVALQQYNQLVTEGDLKLNSPLNEESFFGAVTVLYCLGDKAGLKELFSRQKASAAVLGFDRRMKAYRLIAGEQARSDMISEAMETAKRIDNPVEWARAWSLILQSAARPLPVLPLEPAMLNLLETPHTEQLPTPDIVEQVADEMFQYLAQNKEVHVQISLLQRIAGSRLMCDAALQTFFRNSLAESEVLDDRVKQPVLKFLDDPESPTTDSAMDDWTTSGEHVHVEMIDIDPAPLRSRAGQQGVQALLAIAQGYQSVKWFQDADRVLTQAFAAAQQITDMSVRIPLLMRIGEQQIAVGSTADAQKTFSAVAPALNQNQKGELARLQILARLFDDAQATIASIESPESREYACSLLFQEQIRVNRMSDAEKTLALMQPGNMAAECRSRLNIAQERASREDFNRLGLPFPEGSGQNGEQYCIGLIQQGFLHIANQASSGISDGQKRTDLQIRIAGEYLLLYQAFNDINDSNRSIRQEIQQAVVSVAERGRNPAVQTTMMMDLLMYLAANLQTEADRADGKRLWIRTMEFCRQIAQPDDKVVLFAQLIVAKNLLENPNFQSPNRREAAMPLFTRETNGSAFEETNKLIEECIVLMNSLENEEQQGKACVHLAMALIQIDRTTAAQMLLDRTLEITEHVSDHQTIIAMLLSMIPALKAMNSTGAIPAIYRLAIDAAAQGFSVGSLQIDVYDWRIRDSEIERIVRSQMENGFVDDAAESANRVVEPVLHDRLLRSAIYIYLDQRNIDRAELLAQRLTVKEIRSTVLQHVQHVKRRSEID